MWIIMSCMKSWSWLRVRSGRWRIGWRFMCVIYMYWILLISCWCWILFSVLIVMMFLIMIFFGLILCFLILRVCFLFIWCLCLSIWYYCVGRVVRLFSSLLIRVVILLLLIRWSLSVFFEGWCLLLGFLCFFFFVMWFVLWR